MKKYRTKDTILLSEGLVGMNSSQAARRIHNVEPSGDGTYVIIRPIMFKVGEVVGLESPEKSMLARLECLDPPEEKIRYKEPAVSVPKPVSQDLGQEKRHDTEKRYGKRP